MAHDGLGPKNQPTYAGTGASADAADLTELSQYASVVGNRKAGPTTARTAATGNDVWEGLEWEDTTLNCSFVYTSGAWVYRAGRMPRLLLSGDSSAQGALNANADFYISRRNIDTATVVDSTFNFSRGSFGVTIPVSGIWDVQASVAFAANAGSGRRGLRVGDTNGSTQIPMVTESYFSASFGNGAFVCKTSGQAFIPANAYLNLDTTSNITGDVTGIFRFGLRLVSFA